jgi:hypothetical protein
MAALPSEIPLYLQANGRHVKRTERRKRVRMQVHWPVRFLGHGGVDRETVTRDLSSEGFHCLERVPFVPGESPVCILSVPTNDPKDASRVLLVKCKVRIVWVKAANDGLYSIGCQIESYRFVDSLPADQESTRPNL